MTDPRPDLDPEFDPDVEVASALLDGEGSVAERARAGDPGVVAARRRLARVADGVASVPAPPPGSLDAHVGEALAAFDEAHVATVPDLGARRARRAGPGRHAPRSLVPIGAAAAALVVLLFVGAVGLAAGGGDDDDVASLDTVEDASGAGEDERTGEGEDEVALDGREGDGGEAAEAFGADDHAATPTAEREAFDDFDDLARTLAERGPDDGGTASRAGTPALGPTEEVAPPGEPEEDALGDAGPGGCDPVGAAGVASADVRSVVAVVVAGRPITAVVHGAGDDGTVTAVDEVACSVVDRRPLPR